MDISEVLSSIQNLGREIHRDVILGDFSFTMYPLGSGEEAGVYAWAEEKSKGESQNADSSPIAFRITPYYVHLVRMRIVASAIQKVNGLALPRESTVLDNKGIKREVPDYIFSIVESWPSEIIEYMFIEYNKIQVEVSKMYGFKLAHREVMSVLDDLLRSSAISADAAVAASMPVEDINERASNGSDLSQSEDPS